MLLKLGLASVGQMSYTEARNSLSKELMEARKAEDLEEGEHGLIYASWVFPEYPRYERGFVWFLVVLLIGVGLLLYALISGNFLFAIIILMFALVIYMAAAGEPADVRFSVTEEGVELGRSFYPYKEIRNFWFVYEPPHVKNLYIDFKSSVQPRLTIDLRDQNPNEVRRALSRYLVEDLNEEDEPLSELLGRMFKI
jgi:hypothetical protein